MVVHDREMQQQWVQQRAAQEEKKKKKVKRTRRWSVLGVQSLACLALLLIAFLMKLAGGGAYEELKEGFRSALAENQLMAVLSGLFEEEETDVKELDFTSEKTQQNQGELTLDTATLGAWGKNA